MVKKEVYGTIILVIFVISAGISLAMWVAHNQEERLVKICQACGASSVSETKNDIFGDGLKILCDNETILVTTEYITIISLNKWREAEHTYQVIYSCYDRESPWPYKSFGEEELGAAK